MPDHGRKGLRLWQQSESCARPRLPHVPFAISAGWLALSPFHNDQVNLIIANNGCFVWLGTAAGQCPSPGTCTALECAPNRYCTAARNCTFPQHPSRPSLGQVVSLWDGSSAPVSRVFVAHLPIRLLGQFRHLDTGSLCPQFLMLSKDLSGTVGS